MQICACNGTDRVGGKEQQLGGPLAKQVGRCCGSFKISETDFVEQTSL
jgi:hypothetical protein